jgi:hypothetical protein
MVLPFVYLGQLKLLEDAAQQLIGVHFGPNYLAPRRHLIPCWQFGLVLLLEYLVLEGSLDHHRSNVDLVVLTVAGVDRVAKLVFDYLGVGGEQLKVIPDTHLDVKHEK